MRLKKRSRERKKNELIKEIILKMESIKNKYQIGYKPLLKLTKFSHSTYMRWRRRFRKQLEPVEKAGPKKVVPLDVNAFNRDLEQLRHGKKRTHGTSTLVSDYRHSLSRREIYELVKKARREHHRREKEALFNVAWSSPGTVWAVDVFEYRLEATGEKAFVLTSQDMSTGFKFKPLTLPKEPDGRSVARHFNSLFSMYGTPLFLKRDNGSNLNDSIVKAMIDNYAVLTLNSPPKCPEYNGAIEHTQGEYKNYLREWSTKAQNFREFKLLAALATHSLNHKPRRKLNNMHSCKLFFKKKYEGFAKRKRKEVYEWIADLALDIVEKSGNLLMRNAAWRVAARKWLEINNLISISKNGKVLPNFS